MAPTDRPTAEQRAESRSKYLTGLLWHAGTFGIINAGFWLLDGGVGAAGFQWSWWITVFWGIGLAFHALAYFIDGRDMEGRRAQKYLAEERKGEEESG